MLKKLNSRHRVDVPAEGFGRSKGLLTVVGGLALLVVIIPFLLALVKTTQGSLMSFGLGILVVLVVLTLLAAMGAKPGYRAGRR